MKGQLFIDNTDVYTQFGVSVTKGELCFNLLYLLYLEVQMYLIPAPQI